MLSLDLNILRSAVTLLSFFTFVAIVVWALSKRNKADFDEAAQLPFLDDRAPAASAGRTSSTLTSETRDE